MPSRINGVRVHKPNSNGNFYFRLPQLSIKIHSIDKKKRVVSLANTHVSARTLANEWGVTKDKVLAWRALVGKLREERPTLFNTVLNDFSVARKVRKQYYSKGGNYLRHEYGLSNAGARGLITLMVLLGELEFSSNERKEAIDFAKRNRDALKTSAEEASFRRRFLELREQESGV